MMDRMAEKKKILIDLDVVTIALWEKKDERMPAARKFISRIKGDFHVITPHVLLDTVSLWQNKDLVKSIQAFYWNNTEEFVDNIQIINKINDVAKNGDFEEVFLELEKKGIKEEDIFLVLVCSALELDMVTFNRKHLKSKEDDINDVLSAFGLKTISIFMPDEA